MDFLKMSEEYKQSAERLLRAMKKQKEKAQSEHARNREEINALINGYKKIYTEVIRISNILKKRGEKR